MALAMGTTGALMVGYTPEVARRLAHRGYGPIWSKVVALELGTVLLVAIFALHLWLTGPHVRPRESAKRFVFAASIAFLVPLLLPLSDALVPADSPWSLAVLLMAGVAFAWAADRLAARLGISFRKGPSDAA
jgi:hypothetical protein